MTCVYLHGDRMIIIVVVRERVSLRQHNEFLTFRSSLLRNVHFDIIFRRSDTDTQLSRTV